MPKDLEKKKQLRQHLQKELIQTETSYVNGLETVAKVYKKPMMEKMKKLKVTIEDVQAIFSNLEAIIQLHRIILKEFQASPDDIIKTLNSHAAYFKMYTLFLSGYDKGLQTMDRLRKNKTFQQFLVTQQETGEGGGSCLDIMSYLITPVQRIPRYELMLREILKNSEDGDEDKELIEKTYNQIRSIAMHINEQKRRVENFTKLIKIQNGIRNLSFALFKPARHICKEGVFLMQKNRDKPKERMVFLFNDIFLWTNIKSEYKGHFDICELKLQDAAQDNEGGLKFVILSPRKMLTIHCDLESQKTEWMQTLNQLISKEQANPANVAKLARIGLKLMPQSKDLLSQASEVKSLSLSSTARSDSAKTGEEISPPQSPSSVSRNSTSYSVQAGQALNCNSCGESPWGNSSFCMRCGTPLLFVTSNDDSGPSPGKEGSDSLASPSKEFQAPEPAPRPVSSSTPPKESLKSSGSGSSKPSVPSRRKERGKNSFKRTGTPVGKHRPGTERKKKATNDPSPALKKPKDAKQRIRISRALSAGDTASNIKKKTVMHRRVPSVPAPKRPLMKPPLAPPQRPTDSESVASSVDDARSQDDAQLDSMLKNRPEEASPRVGSPEVVPVETSPTSASPRSPALKPVDLSIGQPLTRGQLMRVPFEDLVDAVRERDARIRELENELGKLKKALASKESKASSRPGVRKQPPPLTKARLSTSRPKPAISVRKSGSPTYTAKSRSPAKSSRLSSPRHKGSGSPPNSARRSPGRSSSPARRSGSTLGETKSPTRPKSARRSPPSSPFKINKRVEAGKALKKKADYLNTIKIGCPVHYESRVGIAKFVGLVHFRAGIWVGIELKEKSGKHNGTVKGKRYFHCKDGHGILVPAANVVVSTKGR